MRENVCVVPKGKRRRSKSPAGLGSAERLMEVTIDVRWTGGGCDQRMMRWCCQRGVRRRRDEKMRSIDEAEAALSD